MASWINRGDSVFFQFRNGKSVLNSQNKPRMFKTAEKATLGVNYIDTDDVVEYAEVVHGQWEIVIDHDEFWGDLEYYKCSLCGCMELRDKEPPYCSNCGAKMDG